MTSTGDDTAQPAPVEAAPRIPSLDGRRLVVRADGDPVIGTGHQMRCLAIASRWTAAGGTARLACTAVPDTVAARYAAAGVEVVQRATWSAGDLLAVGDTVVVDAPGLPGAALAAIAGGPAVLVTIDDMGVRDRYPGDLVLNPNAHASPALYARKTDALLCLGPSWCLLREGFATGRRPDRPVSEPVRRIVALLGGADPKGFSGPVLEAVAAAAGALSPPAAAILVVGAANPALEALRRDVAGRPGQIEIRHDVHDMPALLADADLAVSAAGSTALELASLGVPAILGAQNVTETGPGAALQAAGAALYLGPFEAIRTADLTAAVAALAADPAARQRMRDAGLRLIDGRGVDRLLALVGRLMVRRQAHQR